MLTASEGIVLTRWGGQDGGGRGAHSLGFILITGIDDTGYAVGHQTVAIILDADECRDETLVQLRGDTLCGCRARSTKCWRGSYKPIDSVVAAIRSACEALQVRLRGVTASNQPPSRR